MNHSGITFRSATVADFASIVALQQAVAYARLSPDERRHGFLSVSFTTDQLQRMRDASAIVVASADNQLLGYFALVGADAGGDLPSLGYLAPALTAGTIDGVPLREYRMGLGPQVCVDPTARGRGLALQLFEHLAERLNDRYDFLLGSVHRQNEAGYRFNVEVLGAHVVHEDEVRRFIAMDVRPAALDSLAQRRTRQT